MFATRIANGYPHDRTEGDTIQLCPTLVLVLYVFSAKNHLCNILSALGAGSFVAGRQLKVMLPFVTKTMMQVSPLPLLRIYRLRGRSSAVCGHSGPDAFDFTSSCLTARVLSPGICCQMWHNSLWNLFRRNCQDVFLRLEWRTWGHQGCQGQARVPISFSPYPVHVLQMIECSSGLFKAPEVYGI